MQEYRAYIMGPDGHVQSRVDLQCNDVAKAFKLAKQLADGHDVELWQLDRQIGTVKAQGSRDSFTLANDGSDETRIVGRRAYLSRMHKTAFEPCIPTRGTKVPAGPDWLHEIKHDGYRMIVQRDGKRDVAGHGHVLLIASCGSGFGAQNAPDAWNDCLFRASTLHVAVENLDDRRR